MACRELQPLIKKSPSFQGVMSATRYFWKGPASALANKGEGCALPRELPKSTPTLVSCWCLCVRIKAVIADILYLSSFRLGRFRSLLRVTELSPTRLRTVQVV